MSSSDVSPGSEPRLVRTTGLRPSREGVGERQGPGDVAATEEVGHLRERVAELEGELRRTRAVSEARKARVEELTGELETARRERDDAREWAAFLDRELRENRERVEALESRVGSLESRGLLGRLRELFD
jgi:chromosome segregation ATPase